MRLIEFRYITHRGIEVPIIPLQLKGAIEWFDLWAFVDSGATYSLFRAEDAWDMGIDFKKGNMRMVVVGDGSFIPVYFLKLPMKISDIQFLAEVGFSERLGVGFNLLGRKDVFEIFKVCFSDREKVVTFQKFVTNREKQNTNA